MQRQARRRFSDASGYVVARREAAVASKITGKMVELDIEEGDRVKAGQVIARLDDTNIRASLNAARAQVEFAKAGLSETQVNLANAQRDYERQSSLIKGHCMSQSALDNSRTAMDALTAQLATQRRNVEVTERNVEVAERNLDDTIVRGAIRRRGDRQVGAGGRDRLAASRPGAASPAPASVPSSTWIRSRSKST